MTQEDIKVLFPVIPFRMNLSCSQLDLSTMKITLTPSTDASIVEHEEEEKHDEETDEQNEKRKML